MKDAAKIMTPAAVILIGLIGAGVYSQTKPNYNLSPLQVLRLKDKQKSAAIVQIQANQVGAELQKASAEFFTECEAIKKENNLPKDASCDINNPGVVNPPAKPQMAPPSAPGTKK